ncbi:MAG: succinate dehydrogenase, cytochrome b556 subunit [Bacillota bacterium]
MRGQFSISRRILAWVDFRGRKPGMVAFVIHRVTGVGLLLYLLAHFVVLSLLAAGPEAWDRFVAVAKTPPMLALDVLLVAALLVHGLNGIRLSALGLGFGALRYRQLIWVTWVISAVVTAAVGYGIFATGG